MSSRMVVRYTGADGRYNDLVVNFTIGVLKKLSVLGRKLQTLSLSIDEDVPGVLEHLDERCQVMSRRASFKVTNRIDHLTLLL